MKQEIYLNHPNFGLLYRLCVIEQNQELFTTLYAQRLFFKVTTKPQETIFEPMSRSSARLLTENRLRQLRRLGEFNAYKELNEVYQTIFQ